MRHVTCERCGEFVELLVPSLEVCAPCAERQLVEPLRGPLDLGRLARSLLHLLGAIGIPAALLTIGFELPGLFFFAAVPQAPLQLQVAYGLFTLIAELAVMVLAHEALHGRSVSVLDALGRGLSRYGAVFVTRWLVGLQTLGWLLLLIVPGLYKAITYSLAAPAALFEETSGSDAVRRSMARTSGIVPLLALTSGVLMLAGVAWPFVVGAVAFELVPIELIDEQGNLPFGPAVAIDGLTAIPSALVMMLATLVLQIVYERTTLDERMSEA